MPDGSRKRRHSSDDARRRWYAQHRSRRFCQRFGLGHTTCSIAPPALLTRCVAAVCAV